MQTQPRLFFLPNDLWQIPDFSEKSRSWIYWEYKNIKDFFQKEPRQKPTFAEAAEYLGIAEEKLREFIPK